MPTPTPSIQTQQQREPSSLARVEQNQHTLTAHVPVSRGSHAALLSLHRTVGNQAVSQVIQAKLREKQRGNAPEQDVEQPLAVGSLTSSSSGQPLPEAVRQKMEMAFGQDFSQVRIHEGPQAPSIGAIAYTRGSDIHFAPGTYQPESATGRALLGHELTHVVQQRFGRVNQHVQKNGVAVNNEPSLEHEADQGGIQAIRGNRVNVSEKGTAFQATEAGIPLQMVDPESLKKLVMEHLLQRGRPRQNERNRLPADILEDLDSEREEQARERIREQGARELEQAREQMPEEELERLQARALGASYGLPRRHFNF